MLSWKLSRFTHLNLRSALDEMSTRIDDLEKNIADLMTQAGVEEIEAAPEKQKESQSTSSWRWDRSLSGHPPPAK